MQTDRLIIALEPRWLLSVSPAAAGVDPVPVSGIVFADTVTKNHQPDAGEGLAGCVVTFNNNADHTVSTPVTAADGSFSTELVPGSYHLTVDGPGVAKPFDEPNFVVTVATTLDVRVSADAGTTNPPPAAKTDLAVSVSSPGGMLQLSPSLGAGLAAGRYQLIVTATFSLTSPQVLSFADSIKGPVVTVVTGAGRIGWEHLEREGALRAGTAAWGEGSPGKPRANGGFWWGMKRGSPANGSRARPCCAEFRRTGGGKTTRVGSGATSSGLPGRNRAGR